MKVKLLSGEFVNIVGLDSVGSPEKMQVTGLRVKDNFVLCLYTHSSRSVATLLVCRRAKEVIKTEPVFSPPILPFSGKLVEKQLDNIKDDDYAAVAKMQLPFTNDPHEQESWGVLVQGLPFHTLRLCRDKETIQINGF